MLYFDTVITLVMWVLFAHFIADFILQSDWMAVNKSKNWTALSAHVLTYGAGMLAIMYIGTSWLSRSWEWKEWLFYWVALNTLLHFITDAITSRITSWLWRNEQRHWFFVMIGFDQLIHYACLLGTLSMVIKGVV